MSDVFRTLEDAHRRAAGASGQLALALEKRRFSREVAERCVRQWREAADMLEKSVLKKERK